MVSAERPVLVFAHYFGGSARSWEPLLEALGGGEHVAPDLPGFGGSEPPADPTLDAYADHFAGLAGTRDWIAVGHSMGGKIALAAAARRPANLIGMILIASSPPTPEPIAEAERRASLECYGSRRFALQQFTKTAPRLSPTLMNVCIEDQLHVARPVWRWWLEEGSRVDISTNTDRIDLPVLVISPDDDQVLGAVVATGIASALANATLRTVVDAGHFVTLERPAALARLIEAYVADRTTVRA